MITSALNPKDYFEDYPNKHWNKKRKGMRQGARTMSFEVYATQIMPLDKHEKPLKPIKKFVKKDFKQKLG